ncbi:phosphatase PAP2 family protein [Candidatus Berkelbacteria bacterium]|nr:phosphatase PAP2 family protein [Candidatus Berkelbacteria bacterium]
MRGIKFNQPLFYIPILLLASAGILNFASSAFIATYFPYRQPLDDLLFILLPYVSWTQYWTDLANLFGIALIFFYMLRGRVNKLPFYITIFTVGYLMRALITPLTPLGGPLGNGASYGLTTIEQNGQFPSGHVMILMIAYLLVDGKSEPVIKFLLLASLLIEIVTLLLSNGHYSIDVIGGLLVGYVAYHETKKYEPQLILRS